MLKGLDLYERSAGLDYNEVKKDGYEFILHKASEGYTYLDKKFKTEIPKIKAAGLLTGAYVFSRPSSSKAEDEAQTILRQIKEVGGVDLPPILDMEDNGGLSDSDLQAYVTKWRVAIQKEDSRKPILYVNMNFYNKLKPIIKDFTLWIAEYQVKEPQIKDYAFWQMTNQDKEQGGTFDEDLFNGSLDDLKALCQEPPKEDLQPESDALKSSNQQERKMYQIQSGDTLSQLALNFHIPLQVLARYNTIQNPNEIKAGSYLRIPKVVQVRSGDTVWEYARANNENVSFLGYVNSLDNTSKIVVGQTLYI